MKHKTRDFALKRMKSVDDDVGGYEFEGAFSVLDVLDTDGDRVLTGATVKSTEQRLPKIKDHHGVTVGQATRAVEKDGEFVVAGRIYPTTAGKDLAVLMQQVETSHGPHAPVEEGSIGFTASKQRQEKNDEGGWDYAEVDVWEVSPVTFGANDQTHIGLKSRKAVEGSFEYMGQQVASALREQSVFDSEDVWLHSTFSDRVVVETWSDTEGVKTYEVTFEETGDGYSFGDPTEVTVAETVVPKTRELLDELAGMKTSDALRVVGQLLTWAQHGPSGVNALAKRRAAEGRALNRGDAAEVATLMLDAGDATVGLATVLVREEKATNAQLRHIHGIVGSLTALVHGYPEPEPTPEPKGEDADDAGEDEKSHAEQFLTFEADMLRERVESVIHDEGVES